MTEPLTPRDAKWRTQVRLADGRVGVLVYVPLPAGQHRTDSKRRSSGKQARVQLGQGAFVSVDPTTLTRLSDEEQDT
jgi:hypothetical protein